MIDHKYGIGTLDEGYLLIVRPVNFNLQFVDDRHLGGELFPDTGNASEFQHKIEDISCINYSVCVVFHLDSFGLPVLCPYLSTQLKKVEVLAI